MEICTEYILIIKLTSYDVGHRRAGFGEPLITYCTKHTVVFRNVGLVDSVALSQYIEFM